MIAGNEGDQTGVRCPTCDREIIYNGNYFCEDWAYPADPTDDLPTCDWALSHDDETGTPIGDVDRAVWEQLKISYAPLTNYLAEHPEEDE